jgi:hypothetical protein
MRATAGKLAMVLVALGLGLVTAYLVRGVGAPGAGWQIGDWWTVRVRRVKAFMAEPSPPWAEANQVHFEVTGVLQTEGPRFETLLTFDRPVLAGYKRLELAYDGRTLAPVAGRLTGDGLPDLDWATARPLLEASLIPFDGMSWRQVTGEQISYRVQGLDRNIAGYRVVRDGVEYGWAPGVPWWLWYAAADQVRADLADCSCWQPGAPTRPAILPSHEIPTPAPVLTRPPAQVLDYKLTLQEDKAGTLTVVTTRDGELVFDNDLGTQVISLSWGSPERRMHVYVSLLPGPTPQVNVDKVVTTQPAYSVRPQKMSAALVDGRASLEAPVVAGKIPYVLSIDFGLR